MKKIIVKNKNNQSLFELNPKEKRELDKSFDTLVEFSKNSWSFKIIEANFNAFINLTEVIFNELSKSFPNTWSELEEASIEINRNFLNYLSSLNTFLDQQCKFLTNHFGKSSNELNEFKEMTSYFFDKEFAYRLLYKLRNYTVHYDYSILSIDSFKNITASSNTERITYVPQLLKNELLKFNFGSILNSELESKEDNIKIFDLIHQSIHFYKELNDKVISLIQNDKEKHISIIKSILKINDVDNNQSHLQIMDGKKLKIAQIPFQYLK